MEIHAVPKNNTSADSVIQNSYPSIEEDSRFWLESIASHPMML